MQVFDRGFNDQVQYRIYDRLVEADFDSRRSQNYIVLNGPFTEFGKFFSRYMRRLGKILQAHHPGMYDIWGDFPRLEEKVDVMLVRNDYKSLPVN